MLRIRKTTALILTILALNTTVSFASNTNVDPECLCPMVAGITATSTANSVTISWTALPDIYSSYIVELQKGAPVFFRSSTSGAMGSVVITGTSPATVYTARVSGICLDGQTITAAIVFTTIAAAPYCGSGIVDLGGDFLHPIPISVQGVIVQDQIDVLGDQDAYAFNVPCSGLVTVSLSSVSNDYELSVVTDESSVGPFFSVNPGIYVGPNKEFKEFVSFTLPEGLSYPVRVTARIHGFLNAYNTHDCYSLSYTAPLPCFTDGGGGENMTSGNGSDTNGTPVIKDGHLALHFDSAFQTDEQVDLQVFSSDGRVVLSESTQVFKGENQINVDLPSMSDGVYLVNVTGAFGVKSQKIVIAR